MSDTNDFPDQAQFVGSLDQLKQVTSKGIEFWYARDLQDRLGYSRWESFSDVIARAGVACESAGVNAGNHFQGITKKVSTRLDAGGLTFKKAAIEQGEDKQDDLSLQNIERRLRRHYTVGSTLRNQGRIRPRRS